LKTRPPSPAAGRALLVGAPNFENVSGDEPELAGGQQTVYRGPSSQCERFTRLRFGALPGASDEVGAIARLWQAQEASETAKGVLILTGAAATEARIKRVAPEYRVLHLATHAFVVYGACASAKDIRRGENPLILAGVALAGANQRGNANGERVEDGVLTAEEIATLDLRGVEWAVLSGCDTGSGEIRTAEGVLGLRRAFELAGVGALIMSLWPVEDQTTSQWMEKLYEARLGGASAAESLRKASLDQLARARKTGQSTHPFGWGAFVAVGGFGH
jgi:CHAT domain-containing protein